MMATQPPGRADPLHLGQPGVAAVPGRRGQGRAGDDQVRRAAGHGQVVEEAGDHPGAVPVLRFGELLLQDLAQRPGRLDRDHLLPAAGEFQRQPSRARAYLDDPARVGRQPVQYFWMQPFRADQPVVEFRLEPVQQLPGQGDVGPGIGVPAGREPAQLLAREHAEVRDAVTVRQFPAQ